MTVSCSCYSPEKKRRTKYIARSLDPEWHQTLVFMNIPRAQLVAKTLEVTVWDYDRFKPNDFLGEVLIELSGTSTCIGVTVPHSAEPVLDRILIRYESAESGTATVAGQDCPL